MIGHWVLFAESQRRYKIFHYYSNFVHSLQHFMHEDPHSFPLHLPRVFSLLPVHEWLLLEILCLCTPNIYIFVSTRMFFEMGTYHQCAHLFLFATYFYKIVAKCNKISNRYATHSVPRWQCCWN